MSSFPPPLICFLLLSAIHVHGVNREAWSQTTDAAKDSLVTVNESYFSEAEGRRQGFQVILPPGFSAENKYPLFVQLFGSANMLPTRERPFIRVRPSGRGVWGYRSMSRYDILQVISRAKEAYQIDEDRVYITGTSAGATGIMHTVAQRPDVFAGAVPLVAFGNDLPLENFRNLPIRCEHGVNDWTSAICNVRVQFQKLSTMKGDAVLNEHPTAGHGVRTPPPKTMDWLFEQKRNRSPAHVVYSCEHPRDGKAYWLTMERFMDPHQVAQLEARAKEGNVSVTTRNVRQFSLDLSTAPLRPGMELTVDGAALKFTPGKEQKTLTLVRNGDWQVATTALTSSGTEPTARRIYGAGAAANLFQGEPLLVVHGTGGDKNENQFLKQAADVLARTGGPTFKPASVRFPVRADSNLDDLSLENYNLLLVGSPETNSVLAELASKLPYNIEGGTLLAGQRPPLPLVDSVVGFHFFNPNHPKRIVYIVSPYLDVAGRSQFLKNPRKFLAGSDGFKMIDQPDLLVRGIDHRIRREMQLDGDWKFIQYDGSDISVPDQLTDRVHFAMAHLKVMQKAAKVDLALWWGPEDKGLFGGYDFNWLPAFDPRFYTLADYAVRHRETETMTGTMSGAELKEIFGRWIATEELVTWPKITNESIEVERRYSVVIPMDLVPKLGNRRKVLSAVAPGPDIMPGEVASEIRATKN